MIYLDSSALLKLVREEPETPALRGWLDEREGISKVSSVLARIEVVRASSRWGRIAIASALTLLAGLDLIPSSADVVDSACAVGEAGLRTLDAIHLASALAIRGEITGFCCYDRRLGVAAAMAGLPTMAPGQPAED